MLPSVDQKKVMFIHFVKSIENIKLARPNIEIQPNYSSRHGSNHLQYWENIFEHIQLQPRRTLQNGWRLMLQPFRGRQMSQSGVAKLGDSLFSFFLVVCSSSYFLFPKGSKSPWGNSEIELFVQYFKNSSRYPKSPTNVQ